jgi:hypothetical protein
MAKKLGRETLVKKNGVVIAGVRVKNIAFDFTPADVSDDDSVGFQTLLAESVMRRSCVTVPLTLLCRSSSLI